MVEANGFKGYDIRLLEKNPTGKVISNQILNAISWIYANRFFRNFQPSLPPGFDQIESIVPFVYIPSSNGTTEVFMKGGMLDSHDEIRKGNGYEDFDRMFSGFKIVFRNYSGQALYFNTFDGLTRCDIENLWCNNMLIYEVDKEIRIITPPA